MVKARVLTLGMLMAAATAFGADAPETRSIQVTGEGEVRAVPDEAVLRFKVTGEAQSLREAKDINARRTKALLSALRKTGVEDRNIQTTRLDLHPRYHHTKDGRVFDGYTARKSLTVVLTDIERYGEVLNAAIEAGIDGVGGVEFRSSKVEALQEEARKAAATDAQRKARALAGYFGMKVGPPITIEELGGAPTPRMMERMAFSQAAADERDVLSVGEVTVRSTISARFTLE